MSLRAKIIVYLILLHLVLGGVAFLVLREDRTWLLAVEAIFVLSIAIGWMLVRAFFVPLDLIRTGADLMEERDFSTRFRPVGQPEMDALIDVYNRMTDKLHEERLKVEEHQLLLSKIAEASPSGIVIFDLDGKVNIENPAAQRLLPEGVPDVPRGESRVIAQSGGRLVRVHHGEFFDRGFTRSFYLAEELTEELRASERAAYEQLIRMVSHEVNNSVGAVRSLLESSLNYAAQLRPEDRADFENALHVAITRMGNLNAFVNGFAEVVRLPEPRLESCRLDELLRDILTLVRPDLESRGIHATLRIDDGFEPVRCDKNQMEQVAINIIRNAAEAIGSDGSIEIALRRDGRRQSLTIADSGPGIPTDVLPRLFAPFFSTKRDGRGIGLTLVQEVLKQHGFEFSLQNGPTSGAEFRVSF